MQRIPIRPATEKKVSYFSKIQNHILTIKKELGAFGQGRLLHATEEIYSL